MNETINLDRERVINKLISLLEIKYIYLSNIGFNGHRKSMLIVILEGICSSLTKELSAMVAKIFQEETDFLYRIFSFEYAHQQLKEENLFFVHGCSWEKLIFHHTDTELDSFHEYVVTEKTLSNIQSHFEKEYNKIAVFLDGATFFIEKNNLSHAAYMLHQYIELWFRFVALFVMGKERKSHSIKELQTYIKAFVPELGNLFNSEIEEEQSLLKLLDNAYITTRYENNYYITLEQIHKILDKGNKMESIISLIFKDRLNECAKHELNPKEVITPKKLFFQPNDTELSDFIKSLSKKDFSALKPYPYKNGLYTIGIVTEGYLETSFMISNLLKVCIIAMEADCCSTRSIPEPEHNIKEVLGYILNMIPHNEMELLDVIRDLVLEPETNS
tara:strand:+ start:10610 stop:11773 length:1164 start_codon:yes stop_codon:yes gene_type:complete